MSNEKFISNIISSDFLMLNNKRSGSLAVLNLFEVNKNLKQLVKILAFVKEQPNFKIYIFLSNKFFFNLAKKYASKFLSGENVQIINKFSSVAENISSSNGNTLLLILNNSGASYTCAFASQLLRNNLHLVYNVTENRAVAGSGVYVTRNSMDDYKKLIFLLVIITQILNK